MGEFSIFCSFEKYCLHFVRLSVTRYVVRLSVTSGNNYRYTLAKVVIDMKFDVNNVSGVMSMHMPEKRVFKIQNTNFQIYAIYDFF